MRCPACQAENDSSARFCDQCGGALESGCGRCGAKLDPRSRFCADCGAPRGAAAEAAGAVRERPSAVPREEGERRHLTVMFCDLVGSTQAAAKLDPEDVHAMIQQYQTACHDVISHYGGHIAQYLGDGLLVYFGYPVAHEDDPTRAAHAALDILEKIEQISDPLDRDSDRRLAVRIGIHSGPAVVGQPGGAPRRGKQLFGHTMNLAARLEGVAEPGTAVISDATRKLLRTGFRVRALGEVVLKGIDGPVATHQLLGKSESDEPALLPMVGREQEIALLLDRWDRVREDVGQVLLLEGEAGMGKSRLVDALQEHLSGEDHTWVEIQCSPYHQNSAFYPVVKYLERFVRDGGPAAGDPHAGLERALRDSSIPLDTAVPLVMTLLSLPVPDRYPPLDLGPEARRLATLEILLAWLFAAAEQNPTVVVVEDVHWIDPSSLELLERLVEQAPTARILVVVTARPGFTPPWSHRGHVANLTLLPLSRRQITALVERNAPGPELPEEIVRQLVARADGVPLFAEELTKAVLESNLLTASNDHYQISDHHLDRVIPATLKDSLTARLDRLGEARLVAHLASVIGREFSHALLSKIWPWEGGQLERDLHRLVDAELLYQRGTPPDSTYVFKHALIRDAAYESLLNRQRQEYHVAVARALTDHFPARAETEPELVAKHLEEGGCIEEAVEKYAEAGERATRQSAYQEAVVQLSHAIDLLDQIDAGVRHDALELQLRLELGPAIMGIRGYGDPEVERVYLRARSLCEKASNPLALFDVVWGLANYYQGRAELAHAIELGAELLEIAERAGEKQLLSWAYLQAGAPYFWSGDLRRSMELLERSIELYDPDSSWYQPGAPDPCVASKAYNGTMRCLIGDVVSGFAECREAVDMARERRHPFSLSLALCFLGSSHQWCGDVQTTLATASEVVALAGRNGFPAWVGWAGSMHGWARARSGDPEGVKEMQEALEVTARTGTALGSPGALAMMIDAMVAVGDFDSAAAMLAGARTIARDTHQHAWDAELLRLASEIAARGGSTEQALRDARDGVRVANESGDRLYQLRAALAFDRIAREDGAGEEGRTALADACGHFAADASFPLLDEARRRLADPV